MCNRLDFVCNRALAGITFFEYAIRNTVNKKTYEADARLAEIRKQKYLYAKLPNK